VKNAEKGMLIVGPNGQIFKVLRKDSCKLWDGATKKVECIIGIGCVGDIPQEVTIKKKDICDYRDITHEFSAILEKYNELTDGSDDVIMNIQAENRKLQTNLKKVLEERDEWKNAFDASMDSLKEKEEIIGEFEGSPADVRKASMGGSVEDIRNSYGKG